MKNLDLFTDVGSWLRAVQLFALIIVGAAVYIASVRVINPKDFDSLMAIIRRKKPIPSEALSTGPVNGKNDREA